MMTASDDSTLDAEFEQDSSRGTRRRNVAGIAASVVVLTALGGGIAVAATSGAANQQPLTVIDGSPSATTTLAPPITSAAPAAPSTTAVPATAPETMAAPSADAEPESSEDADGGDASTDHSGSNYDITSPESLTVLVNKHHPVNPETYAPGDLVNVADLGIPSMNGHAIRQPAADAMVQLFAAASAAGHSLDMTSGYRDYNLQSELYDDEVALNGQASADALVARPGHSEHQTGLAADFSAPGESDCILTECFAETAAGQWLAEHSWEYGFILRYPQGAESITGIQYEPWHFRFVGTEVAAAFHASGAQTYEEFLGSDPAPSY